MDDEYKIKSILDNITIVPETDDHHYIDDPEDPPGQGTG